MEQVEQQHDKRGSVLLLTLIITMIVLTSSVVLGTLIIGSLRRSQTESSAIIAYYAAESLMEKTLYDLRKEKKSPVDITTNNCSALPGGYPGIATSACNASAVYDTSISFNYTNKNQINKNQTAHVRLIDSVALTAGAGVKKIDITCGSASGAWAEVTATVISYHVNPSSDFWYPDPQNTIKHLFSCTSFITYPITLDVNRSYDIAVKALYNNLSGFTGVKITAYDSNNNLAGIGDSFTINASVDNSLFSRQTIKVEMKGVSTVSSLFDYVVYSEQTIDKNILPGTS